MTAIQAYIDSSHLLGHADELRGRMAADGYLFFPGLLPGQPLQELWDAILGICQEEGWIGGEGTVLGEPRPEGSPDFWAVYDRIQTLQPFHGLAHRAEILAVIEALVAETPFVHPRNIARISFPQAEDFTTPAHQDFIHVQGSAETYTAWIPLSDCPRELGGLAVLSHPVGAEILPVHRAKGAGGLGIAVDPDDPRWRTVDYRRGDVVIFHSLTVHKGLPNHTGNRLRLSVDYRYQGVSQPIVVDGLLPHYNRMTWDEIYRDWPDDRFRYYWRELGIATVERDRSFHANAPEKPGS